MQFFLELVLLEWIRADDREWDLETLHLEGFVVDYFEIVP